MKKIIKTICCFLVLLSYTFVNISFGQADSHAAMHAPVTKVITNRVMDKALTDSGLVNKKISIIEYTFPQVIPTPFLTGMAQKYLYMLVKAL